MALRKNTNMANAQAIASTDLFNSGTLQIRTGSQPASANDAATGTLLVTITLPASAFGSPTGGVIGKAGTWSGTAVADGTAGYARFVSSANDQRMDVSVGEAATDMIIDNAAILTNGVVTVTSFDFTVPLTA
jgi:hypothetical protein